MIHENEHILSSYARQKMNEAHHLAEAERLARLAEAPAGRTRRLVSAALWLVAVAGTLLAGTILF